MTRRLIAVTSYFPDAVRGCHQAIREGWGKDVAPAEADLRFFVPYPHFNDDVNKTGLDAYAAQPDEVYLSMDGNYNNITRQVWEILKFSLQHNYDRVFLCANDTFVLPRRVFSGEFEKYDYAGEIYPPEYSVSFGIVPIGSRFDWRWYETKIPNVFNWMGAGIGILLSKKAIELIVSNPPDRWISEHSLYGFAYDVWIGQVLGPKIESKEIFVANINNVSWHYIHSPNEQRYSGVQEWQKKYVSKVKKCNHIKCTLRLRTETFPCSYQSSTGESVCPSTPSTSRISNHTVCFGRQNPTLL